MLERVNPYDVIVVGAGPAGLIVAEHLEEAGKRVLLIDAGPQRYVDPLSSPAPPARVGANTNQWISRPTADPAAAGSWRFRTIGADAWWPRAYAVGGRAHLWGRVLSRFSPRAFREGNWPYGWRTLSPYYERAEAWLGATLDPPDARFARAGRALGMRVPRGMYATRLGRGLQAGVAAKARANTVAVRIEPDRKRTAVHVVSDGKRDTLVARSVVLAASPIETVRILLESGLRHAWLGRRLTDHMALGYILLEPNRAPATLPFPRAIIPRFVNRGDERDRSYNGGYYVEIRGPAPEEHLREEFRPLLGKGFPAGGSFTLIHAIGEQWPHRDRKVDLAPRARDSFGRRVPQIHFAWSRAERRMVEDMKASCLAVADAIASPGAELIRMSDPFVHPAIFHPAGTCAMGVGSDAPCDPRGRFRPAPSLWIADASTFPSCGDAPPTVTILANALRVAEAVRDSISAPG